MNNRSPAAMAASRPSGRSAFDVPAANECSECKGQGYTYSTAQLGKQTPNGYVTTQIGHGCLSCGGVGRIVEDQ